MGIRRLSRPRRDRLIAGVLFGAMAAVVAGRAAAKAGRVRAGQPDVVPATVDPSPAPAAGKRPGNRGPRRCRPLSGGIAAVLLIAMIVAVVVAPAVITDSGDVGDTLALTPPPTATVRPAPASWLGMAPTMANLDQSKSPTDVVDPAPAPVTPELDLSASPTAAPNTAGVPTSIDIAAIGVHASITPLGLGADGVIQVPGDFEQAGWYSGGPRPGDDGPAVILGHVDSRSGPAVFFRLKDLRPGDAILVTSSTGTESFIVDSTANYPKTGFPTEAVYGPVSGRALRLVTCGGKFDDVRRSYLSNVIVFATPAA